MSLTPETPWPGSGTSERGSSGPEPPPRIELHGVVVHGVDASGAIEHVARALDAGVGGWVLTINVDILRRLRRERAFADLCRGVTLRLADGMPLVWASRLQRTPLPERVAGSDLIWSLTARAARDGRSVYLLGGNPGSAASAARRLEQEYPGLRVAGIECPPVGFERDPGYMSALRDHVVQARPDIVYVALGCPKQERLIDRLRADHPGAWYLGVGISFSFVSGEVKRAPEFFQKHGLEWLHRLVQEPRRLTRRYFIYGVPQALSLLGTAALRGMGRRHRTRWEHRA